jgi:3-methyladenine DNA glycosylase AlkC
LAILSDWAKDENPHVRRLVSEGTRPRLPWTMQLKPFIEDPRPVLKLLEKLKTDPVLMVRRSVANNLNDIAKDNPDLVVKTLRRWKKSTTKARNGSSATPRGRWSSRGIRRRWRYWDLIRSRDRGLEDPT